MNRLFVLCVFLITIQTASAQVRVTQNQKSKSAFTLVSNRATPIYYDQKDAEVVRRTAHLFADDVYSVTGKKPELINTENDLRKNIIIVGTIENNSLIQELLRQKRIDASVVKDGWEQYVITLVEKPFKGVDKALVIAGSDRRGAAYGLLSISEAIGVSPWYWWADVPLKKRNDIYLEIKTFASSTPSVKYRGIFINDEDWGLHPWSAKTFEPEVKDIGPKTYAKICELLLRLKANYLSPAMHSITGAFNKYPGNKLVADSFGIVMGSIHAEPLLFNNASEWDTKTMGEWNYVKNKDGINKVLRKRVEENGRFENVYTLALRGIHDAVMEGDLNMQERVDVLGRALQDQRNILRDILKQPVETVPQIFYPYKEVLDVYNAGLKVPDDVTIVWTDDDYGYIKRLSNSMEQQRKGRAGVYYHVSYWGPPNDNLWLCTTPPQLMYQELRKAYETTADRLWVVNVGDIKPAEYHISLFLGMAYDMRKFNEENIVAHQADFLSSIFGNKYRDDFLDISKMYHQLAFQRKPEYIKNTRSDVFSVQHYRELDDRINEYTRIAEKSKAIMGKLDEHLIPSYFQLVYYPVKGSELFNLMWLGSQKANYFASKGNVTANLLRRTVVAAADSLQKLTETYNSLLGGKWKGMMSLSNGGGRFYIPAMDSVLLSGNSALDVIVEGQSDIKAENNIKALPAFNKFFEKAYYFDVYNKGTGAIKWSASTTQSWIKLDKTSGIVTTQDRVNVSINWSKAPVGEGITGEIIISDDIGSKKIFASVFNPASPASEDLKDMYVEDNGVVSIDATDFNRKKETADIKFKALEGLGLNGKVIQLGDPFARNPHFPSLELTSNYVAPVRSNDLPVLEYDFYSFNSGPVDVYTYVVPVFSLNNEHGSRYGVMVDNSPVYLPEASAPYYSTLWIQSILRNTRINKTTHMIDKRGKHTVRIYAGHPGVLLQKIVVDFGGMKKSYMGPGFTKGK
jgi:hypothetical protein